MKQKTLLMLFAFTVAFQGLKAQVLEQNIRGTVSDKNLGTPLKGIVVVLDTLYNQADTTDENGNFEFTHVPVGRHSIRASKVGYSEVLKSNLLLNSGKELIIQIHMEENIKSFKKFSVKTNHQNKPLNDMATVSARSFSSEETQNYAAAINDPARMATSFAGVVGADDGNNTIVIRGNSPAGMLWRMEGIDIPGPNHFSGFTGTGGGVSILSAQLLGNSDFYTGAFPAEYGNALSGVFDLRLRNGNAKKREYTFQAGVLGIDFAAEGPLHKKGGSFLVNYRYSTLGILQKMGLDMVGIPVFQDLSFNVKFPKSKLGEFSMFGFGGLSKQVQYAAKDSLKWESNMDKFNFIFNSNTGASGLTHKIRLGTYSHLKTVVLVSKNVISDKGESYRGDYSKTYTEWFNKVDNTRYSLHSILNQRLSSALHLRAGVILNHWVYTAAQKSRDTVDILRTFIDSRGETDYGQAYAQVKARISNKLSLISGLHSLYMGLNNKASIEPRASLKYQYSKRKLISLGYGNHAQLQLPGVYFVEVTQLNGSKTFPNKSLGFSRANHYIAAYEYQLEQGARVKLEAYYQDLYNIPSDPTGTYSVLNTAWGTAPHELQSTGKGINKGVELTLEKSLSSGFYYLISGSLYDSKYTTGDGVWRNTTFNGGHSLSATGGREFRWKEGKRVFGINFKTLWYGGFRETPIDIEMSRKYNTEILDETKLNTLQVPNYFRTDIKLSYRINHKGFNSIWSLDLQNASNRKNIGGSYYDVDKEKVMRWYQMGLLPVFSYKVEF